MPDPAEKSDDLIAELAKLMATPVPAPGPARPPESATPAAVPPPIPVEPASPVEPQAPAPVPVRIPGMEAPRQSTVTPVASAPEASRGPTTGVIRIPGMSQPAPVAASAPVGKLDLGGPANPAPSEQSFSSLADRIAARAAEADAKAKAQASASPPQAPTQQADSGAAPLRFPQLRTVSENKSFAQGPAISLPNATPAATPPAPAPAPIASASAPVTPPAASDFTFDFGFSNPPAAKASTSEANADPIAALINANMAEAPSRPAPVIPVLRTTAPTPRPSPVTPPPAPRPAANAPIPLKPLNPVQSNPEADRFSVAPDTGLNMRTPVSRPLNPPAAPRAPQVVQPPAADNDPMAEIESLIGEAVRVELNPGPVRVQAAQPVAAHVEIEPETEVRQEIHSEPVPVVPPLSTQFAPRRSAIPDEGHAAAEDAILEAAAATGAQVDRIEPSMADERPYRRLKVKSQRASYGSSGLRQYVGMAVAGTLLLAAGLGLYWVLNMGRPVSPDGAAAPQLTAATAQVKEVPKPEAKPVTDVAKSPVLQQMGGASQAPSAEQLVTTDQTAGASTVAETAVATADAGDDNTEGGLANRKVRTVTVRPDGTIVSGDDGVAGNEALPVERPNVPSVPSNETTNLLGSDTSPIVADATGTPNSTASAATLVPLANVPDTAGADSEDQPVIDPTAVAPVPMSFPVRVASATTQPAPSQAATQAPRNSVNAVITGAQTPNGQIDLLGSDALAPRRSTAPAAQPAQVATAAPASTASAAAYVQLASSMSQAEANAAIKSETARYGSLFGGNRLVVQQADLGAKGVRWRVRLPAASLADANAICAQIKAQGGDCFATNG